MRGSDRRFRLTMFGLLYFVQGAALAYFRNFQKPYLDRVGIDADVIGLLTSVLLLPFVLKIFIGMLSDRVALLGMGHRKPYMLIGLLLAVLAFGGAAFVPPDANFLLFSALVVLGSFSVALFDSTTDGLAIDTTPRAEQGVVQGTMVGGRAAGFIVLSLVFGALVQGAGYRVVFLIIAAGMLLPVLWVTRVREPAARAEAQRFDRAAFRALGRPRFLLFAAYAVAYSVVSFGVDGLVTFYMSEGFGAPETLIGAYGALRGVGAAAGALAGGLLLDRIGRQAGAFGAVAAISLGAALIGAAGGTPALLALGVLWGAAWGFQETVFVALAMDLADARIAATMFAIMMAVSNIGTAVGEGVATGLTDDIGFTAVFWLLAGLNAVTVPLLWALFRTAPEIATPPEPAQVEVAMD
jgi:PAT family beta-lactamase induction signal transducer AmpG